MYTTLNEAATKQNLPILEKGDVKIWYVKQHLFPDFVWGLDYARKCQLVEGQKIDKKTIQYTHVLVGEVVGSGNLDDIFSVMQGENWSPQGEARNLISSLNLGHTSMSVGDVIETPDSMWMVDILGFSEIK